MEQPHIELLREAGRAGAAPPGALRAVFVRLNRMMEDIATDLKVEYLGQAGVTGRNSDRRIAASARHFSP